MKSVKLNLNLIDFPIYMQNDRYGKKSYRFEDYEIIFEGGATNHLDYQVLVYAIAKSQTTGDKTIFLDNKELCEFLGRKKSGAVYKRITESVKRWSKVQCLYSKNFTVKAGRKDSNTVNYVSLYKKFRQGLEVSLDDGLLDICNLSYSKRFEFDKYARMTPMQARVFDYVSTKVYGLELFDIELNRLCKILPVILEGPKKNSAKIKKIVDSVLELGDIGVDINFSIEKCEDTGKRYALFYDKEILLKIAKERRFGKTGIPLFRKEPTPGFDGQGVEQGLIGQQAAQVVQEPVPVQVYTTPAAECQVITEPQVVQRQVKTVNHAAVFEENFHDYSKNSADREKIAKNQHVYTEAIAWINKHMPDVQTRFLVSHRDNVILWFHWWSKAIMFEKKDSLSKIKGEAVTAFFKKPSKDEFPRYKKEEQRIEDAENAEDMEKEREKRFVQVKKEVVANIKKLSNDVKEAAWANAFYDRINFPNLKKDILNYFIDVYMGNNEFHSRLRQHEFYKTIDWRIIVAPARIPQMQKMQEEEKERVANLGKMDFFKEGKKSSAKQKRDEYLQYMRNQKKGV